MKRVLLTGYKGLVGSAVARLAPLHSEVLEFHFSGTRDADLTHQDDVESLFNRVRPHYVIHTAAKVGGIGGNMIGHADYFLQNIKMNANVINCCYGYNVEKLLAFSSVCVFPDNLQILTEDKMHDGPPFSGNFAYAHAKRMVDVHIQALKSQHGIKNFCSIIPSNIIGTHDLYNLEHGHVLPSLIHKIYLAKKNKTDLTVWGDGKSLREFISSDDVAEILLRLLIEKDEIPDRLIVAGDCQYSIREMVKFLVDASDFKGNIVYDESKPNGQRHRQSDISRLMNLFPEFKHTPVWETVEESYKWFENNYPNVRL